MDILKTSVVLLTLSLLFSCSSEQNLREPSEAPQPYAYMTATQTGTISPYSPDKIMDWRWSETHPDDPLEIYTLKPVTVTTDNPFSFKNLSSLKKSPAKVVVQGTGSIMLDFGQNNAGWLEFDSDDFSGEVEMSISEYNEPAILNRGAQNRIKTLEPVKHGNTYRLELNDELFEGVRYGWIHVRSFDKKWHISNVRLVCQVKPVNYEGSFSCSDTMLSRIWYVGAYGVKLNLLEDYFGAILMERSDRFSWTGDAYPTQAASLVAFANYDYIKKNLFHTSKQNNGILSYSLYWIQSLQDYFYYTGDTVTLEHFIENACEKLDLAYSHFGTDPRLRYYGWDERLGAGFENHSCEESQWAYRMLTIESWYDFAKMVKLVGRDDLYEKYAGYAIEKLNQVRSDPTWPGIMGVHAAADAINTGLLTEEEVDDLMNNEFSDRLQRLSYSPFNQYFIIRAMAKAREYSKTMQTILDQWGGQIKYGGTTFFEVFRPSWNNVLDYNDPPPNNQCGYTSMAHPWGGGVVHWISEEVLGVKPVLPGFKKTSIMPQLPGDLEWIKGDVPTPQGKIHVDFHVKEGTGLVTIPQGITADIGIPGNERIIQSVRMNGELVYSARDKAVERNISVTTNDQFVVLQGIEPGEYNFTFQYSKEKPGVPTEKLNYKAKVFEQDSITGGNWIGKYGHEGYALFNAASENGKKIDLLKYPSDIESITHRLAFDTCWNITDPGESALVIPGETNRRTTCGIMTQDPRPTWQTMTIDVKVLSEADRLFTIYLADFDSQNRRVAIELFDLDTKNLIAPVQLVENFDGGVYLMYGYNSSVRFRINHVRGPNAVASGLFVDSK